MRESGLSFAAVMKTLLAAAATISCCMMMLSGCQKETAPQRPSRERQCLVLETKSALSRSDSAEVFVYNDDHLRRLDTYQKVPLKDGRATVAYTPGDKLMAFLSNGPSRAYLWQETNSFAYIESLEADFALEREGAHIMSGICRHPREKSVELEPLVSQVILRSIRCDFSQRPYHGATLTEGKVYLTNASSICKIFSFDDFPTRGTLNTGGLNALDLSHLNSPALLYGELPKEIGKEKVYVDKILYCYPNTNIEDTPLTPFTRLVVEGKINGQLWYYPININRRGIGPTQGLEGVDRGKSYIYDLTILRTGTTDPDSPITPFEVKITCSVAPWVEKGKRDEVF